MERAVREQMHTLRDRYPHSPFALLSPLAEGADRLVAKLAIDLLGADLYVPLPMPEDEYRTDFADEASQNEYDALRHQAEAVFELDVDGPGEARDRPFYYPNETELVHVHSETGTVEITESADGEERAPLKWLDRYNEEVAAATLDASAREQSVDYLLGEATGRDEVRERLGAQLLSTYATADTPSIDLQSRFRRYLKGIYALSAGGIVGFALLDLWPPAIAICLLCTAAAIGVLQ